MWMRSVFQTIQLPVLNQALLRIPVAVHTMGWLSGQWAKRQGVCVWGQWRIWFWKARKGKWCWGVRGSESIWETETTGARPDLVISSILKHTSKYTHLVPLPHQTDSLNPSTKHNQSPPLLFLLSILYPSSPSLSLSLPCLYLGVKAAYSGLIWFFRMVQFSFRCGVNESALHVSYCVCFLNLY